MMGCALRDSLFWENLSMDVETEFDALFTRAGLAVPPERRQAMIAGYAELRKRVALLRSDRSASAAPSSGFSVIPLIRERLI